MYPEPGAQNQTSSPANTDFYRTRIGKILLFFCSLLFFFTGTGNASTASSDLPPVPAGRYVIVLKDSNMKAFVRSTLHNFDTVIPKFSGTLTLPDNGALSEVRFHLEFPTADMDTGNFLRNKAMRDKALEVEKFPKAGFDAQAIKFIRQTNAEWDYQITGVLSLHGVQREITVPVRVRSEKRNIVATAKFPFSLKSHKISPPGLLFIQVEDKVELTVRLSFRKQ